MLYSSTSKSWFEIQPCDVEKLDKLSRQPSSFPKLPIITLQRVDITSIKPAHHHCPTRKKAAANDPRQLKPGRNGDSEIERKGTRGPRRNLNRRCGSAM